MAYFRQINHEAPGSFLPRPCLIDLYVIVPTSSCTVFPVQHSVPGSTNNRPVLPRFADMMTRDLLFICRECLSASEKSLSVGFMSFTLDAPCLSSSSSHDRMYTKTVCCSDPGTAIYTYPVHSCKKNAAAFVSLPCSMHCPQKHRQAAGLLSMGIHYPLMAASITGSGFIGICFFCVFSESDSCRYIFRVSPLPSGSG